MYTVCPKCTLALAVSAADLRAGQGYVRCGRCANVFNALLGLRDETDTSPGLPLEPPRPDPPAEAPPEPAPLGGEDRRTSRRPPPPQQGLDLDLSPAMPAPSEEPMVDLALDPASTGEALLIDLPVEPDPPGRPAELDLSVTPATADEPEIDLVFDADDLSPEVEEIILDVPPETTGEREILLEAPVEAEPAPAPAPAPAPPPPAPRAAPAATSPQPAASRPPPPPAMAQAPPTRPAATRPLPAAPAQAAATPPPAAPVLPPPIPRTPPPAGGLTPLSVDLPATALPAGGLTPLRGGGEERIELPGLKADGYTGTGTYETIVLQGDSILQTEEVLPESEFDERIAAVAHQLAADLPAAPAAGKQDASRAPATPLVAEPGEEPVDSLAADIAAAVAQIGPPPARPRHAWAAPAATVLALLLGVQAAHHWRNRLATVPWLNGPLVHLYASLGQPLAPEWDLGAYDLRLVGASADASDARTIHVRLSLANRAGAAQDLPVVRLRLIDRYGKPLSAGELRPAQYLPPAQAALTRIGPDQRIDTDVRVLDPTQQASSFELDVCLPRAGGGLRCAGDASFAGNRP